MKKIKILNYEGIESGLLVTVEFQFKLNKSLKQVYEVKFNNQDIIDYLDKFHKIKIKKYEDKDYYNNLIYEEYSKKENEIDSYFINKFLKENYPDYHIEYDF